MATCHTIIGAKRFHFRVRDGVGWFTLAMVTKQTGVESRLKVQGSRRKALLLTFCFVPSLWSLSCLSLRQPSGFCLSTLSRHKCGFRLFSFAFSLVPAFRKSVTLASLASKLQLSGRIVASGCFRPFAFHLVPASPTGLTGSNLDALAFVRWIPWRLSIKLIGCYMVKPHGQLVHVSCIHYWTSTPCLSTS
jgi:hypothetical protein